MAAVLTFDVQKAKGDTAEGRVAKVFHAHGWRAELCGAGARRDLIVTMGDPVRLAEFLEVKNEEKYAASGKICVEVNQGRVPRLSGVMLSETTFCVHYFGLRSLIMRTLPLRYYVMDLARQNREPVPFRGSDNHNRGYLIPRINLAYGCEWASECDTDKLPAAMIELAKRPYTLHVR